MHVVLKDFLLYGHFAKLKAGMHVSELKALFGLPEDLVDQTEQLPAIMKYQSLQLFIDQDQLTSVALYSMYRVGPLFHVFYLPDRLSIKPNLNHNNMTMAEMREFLGQAGIGYRLVWRSEQDDSETWRTAGGVQISFSISEDYIDALYCNLA